MNRPRPLLRSLVAATCGTTLLAAAVLGTGAAAFAQEVGDPVLTEQAAGSEADSTTTAEMDPATAEEQAASETTDPADSADSAVETSAADQEAADDPRRDAAQDDPAETVVAPSETLAPAAPTARSTRTEIAAFPEESALPSLRVNAPRPVPLAGALQEFDMVVENWDAVSVEDKKRMGEPRVLLTVPVEQDFADLVTFEILQNGNWKALELDWVKDQLEGSFSLPEGTARLRVGVPQDSYEAFWQDFLDFFDFQAEDLGGEDSLNALVAPLADEPEPLTTIQFSTQLLLVGLDSRVDDHTINVLAPELDLLQPAPEEARAGESFKVSYRITNRTGSDYPTDAHLGLFQGAGLVTDDELDELDAMLEAGEISEEEYVELLLDLASVEAGEMTVVCSVGTGPTREIPLTENPFAGTGGVLYSGGLKTGNSINVNCSVSVSRDVPDAGLVLVPMLTIGKIGAPLAFDQELVQEVSILAAESTQPKPTPAQPAPVRPAPKPSNPPAAAPVRQVPTTELPRTGTDPLPLAAAGLGLVLAGAGALLGGRRRAHN